MDFFDDFNWDNLSEPQAFFKLSDGFDKKDLKRSYNKYIKRFKPETYPEEFQKIRKAYEEALDFLRDGSFKEIIDIDSESSILDDYSEISSEFGYDDILENSEEIDNEVLEGINLEREKLLKWLDEKPLDDFYNALKENADNPINYYHLAIVSDVVSSEEDFIFWILKGIKKFGYQNEVLGDILNEFVKKNNIGSGWSESALIFSKKCPASLYYQCLSDMMSELGHSLDSKKFIKLLNDCEENLDFHDDYLSDKCYFYLKIIIEFALKGDMSWLEEKYDYIDQNQDLLSEPAFEYFELIGSLFAFREISVIFDEQIKSNELTNAISKCIKSFCTRDGIEMDQTFLATLAVIEKSKKKLLDLVTFNVENSYLHLMFHIFFFIASNQSARLPFEDEPETRVSTGEEIANLVVEVDKKTNASFIGSFWGIFNLGYMGILGLICLLPFLLFYVIDSTAIVWGLVGVWALISWFFIKPQWDVLRDKINIAIAVRCYKKLWRPIVLKYLLEYQCPLDILLAGVESISNDEQNTPYLHMFMDSDALLTLISIANRFK